MRRVKRRSLSPITDIQMQNAGSEGDRICMTGAFSGFHCGKLRTGGAGGGYKTRFPDGKVGVLLNIHSGDFGAETLPGDSGAPVFNPHPNRADESAAFGLGIFFARERANHHIDFFSQAENVQTELDVSICTKSNPC